MIVALAIAWLVAVFFVWCLCVAAGRADDAADEMARRAAQAFDSTEIGELALPWPGAWRLTQVREQFPDLPEQMVYAVAQARARLARRAPGSLG